MKMELVDGVAIYLLDPQVDQVQEISSILEKYTDLEAIDIVSHGTVGEFQLGNQRINSETLSGYADELKAWGDALAEDGDILLYGCNVAGYEGFLEDIAKLTKADVSGSDDATGNESVGGDWELEVATGSIEAVTILSADSAKAFSGVLADTDGDGLDDLVDLDDDNDGILDTEEVKTNSAYASTSVQSIAGVGGTTTDILDLASLGYSVGDTININQTNLLLAGDFGNGTETLTLTFNQNLPSTVTISGVNSDGAATGFDQINQATTATLTVVDIGSGTPGLTYQATTTTGVSNTQYGGPRFDLRIPDVNVYNSDFDGDGIINSLDLDSDNDGVSDLLESGNTNAVAADVNNDGTISLAESADSNSDGLLDIFGNGTNPVDTDRDGYDDFRDIDSDRDGIVDIVESQSTSGYQDAISKAIEKRQAYQQRRV